MARSSSRATSRRRFLKVAGVAGLSAALTAPAIALAQSAGRSAPKPRPKPEPVSKASPDTTAKAAPPSEFAPDAKAMTEVIRRRYGKFLDAKQLTSVTEELDFRMQAGQKLRAFKLANADEPEFTFHA